MTYAELKAKLDTFTPEQLAAEVRWWGDERGGRIERVDLLDEPWVQTGEGFEPFSSYSDDPDMVAELDGAETLPTGTPILAVDE